MKIQFVVPNSASRTKGNFVTATRWAAICRELGHRTKICRVDDFKVKWNADVLVGLHAVHSAPVIAEFRGRFPARPIGVMLTGTDMVAAGQKRTAAAQRSMQTADFLVTLNQMAKDWLPADLQTKAFVIPQSAQVGNVKRIKPLSSVFEVCVVGHLRKEKDPFRPALAARLLPEASRIRVHHFGAALSAAFARRAAQLSASESRYRWFGHYPRWKVLRRIARSRVLVQPSRSEGGASTISEAILLSTPIIASRISGNVGILGADYPALFECENTQQLSDLLFRFETDRQFHQHVAAATRALQSLVSPTNEQRRIKQLLNQFTR
ncbi:MAG: TIGR04348 family glycosyltransferase [Planctomycetales bacterium]|nr:TIGR04348 family glycosyltransferase [Planctomycetales bacterium]